MNDESEKLNLYQEVLDCYGYNPKADGLAATLERLHKESLTEALAARAFKEWKQARRAKEKND